MNRSRRRGGKSPWLISARRIASAYAQRPKAPFQQLTVVREPFFEGVQAAQTNRGRRGRQCYLGGTEIQIHPTGTVDLHLSHLVDSNSLS